MECGRLRELNVGRAARLVTRRRGGGPTARPGRLLWVTAGVMRPSARLGVDANGGISHGVVSAGVRRLLPAPVSSGCVLPRTVRSVGRKSPCSVGTHACDGVLNELCQLLQPRVIY
jgi:hypothetical protein